MIWTGIQFGFGLGIGVWFCVFAIRNRQRSVRAAIAAFWRFIDSLATMRWWFKLAIWLGPAILLMTMGAEQMGTWLAAGIFAAFFLARLLFELRQRRRPSPRTSLDRCF
jgi:hypothetical protein